MTMNKRWGVLLIFLVHHPLTAGEGVADLMHSTYKITNPGSTATCFLVKRTAGDDSQGSPVYVVTAAHVFEKMQGDFSEIVLRKKNKEGSFDRDPIRVAVRQKGRPLWFKHPQADVAVIPLSIPKGRFFSMLDFDQIVSHQMIKKGVPSCSDEVWIPGYPAQLESTSAGFPVLRRGTVASFPLTPTSKNGTFLIAAATFGGDSGAPVLVGGGGDSQPKAAALALVGLVVGKHRETSRTVTPSEERTIHRSLGLAIVVHSHLIRETIQIAGRESGQDGG